MHTYIYIRWRSLVKIIGGNQNIAGAKGGTTDESIGVSQLLGACVRAALP